MFLGIFPAVIYLSSTSIHRPFVTFNTFYKSQTNWQKGVLGMIISFLTHFNISISLVWYMWGIIIYLDACSVALNIVGYPATQSSVWQQYEAHYAVDGDATADFNEAHCTATDHHPYPWWGLDLKGTFAVTEVTLVNRLLACKFLQGIIVMIACPLHIS